MSRRTIISLAASAIIAIGFIGTVSTDASAYRAGVARGGVIVVVSIVAAFTVVAITVVYARAWRWALVLLRLELPPSVRLPRALITAGQAITALRRSVVRTATIIMPPTIAVYPRHNGAVALNRKLRARPQPQIKTPRKAITSGSHLCAPKLLPALPPGGAPCRNGGIHPPANAESGA